MFSLDNHYTLLELQTDHLTKKNPTKQTNFYYYIYKTLEMHVNLEIVHNDLDFLKIVISTYRNNTLSSSP